MLAAGRTGRCFSTDRGAALTGVWQEPQLGEKLAGGCLGCALPGLAIATA
jgi:hypothetical protein